jgi:Bacterial antitoxin of type II TA system, VapB
MCDTLHIGGGATVATNLAIDDKLINEARRIGKHKTKKEAVTAALDEYIRHRKQLEILKLAGTIDYDPTYDYKKMRKLDKIELDR